MAEQFFYGHCTEQDLINFSLKVIGIQSCKKLPTLPVSRKRKSGHKLLDFLNQPVEAKVIVILDSLEASFHLGKKVNLAKWTSAKGSTITFRRGGKKSFLFNLCEKGDGSHYRKILEGSRVVVLPK